MSCSPAPTVNGSVPPARSDSAALRGADHGQPSDPYPPQFVARNVWHVAIEHDVARFAGQPVEEQSSGHGRRRPMGTLPVGRVAAGQRYGQGRPPLVVRREGGSDGPGVQDRPAGVGPPVDPDSTTSGAGPNAPSMANRHIRAGVALTANTAPGAQPGQLWRSATSSRPTVTPATAALDPLLSQFGATTKTSWPRSRATDARAVRPAEPMPSSFVIRTRNTSTLPGGALNGPLESSCNLPPTRSPRSGSRKGTSQGPLRDPSCWPCAGELTLRSPSTTCTPGTGNDGPGKPFVADGTARAQVTGTEPASAGRGPEA